MMLKFMGRSKSHRGPSETKKDEYRISRQNQRFLKATSYWAKHTRAVYKKGRLKFALYILKVLFILLWGKTLFASFAFQDLKLNAKTFQICQVQNLRFHVHLPDHIFHLAVAFSPALPVAGPWDASLWGVGFNLNFWFFQTLLFCEHESPEFQDKPRLSRTLSFLLKCLQERACFEKTLEMISDLAKGVYLLPAVIFLSEYTFVRGILFLYLVQNFFISFLTVHA